MQNPLVSIIIPTYNRAHLIGETLDSVIAQTYTNWECIVVDDGSKDNTNEVLKIYCDKDNRINYYHRPKDRLPGGNAARNYGFELCKGEYVNWLDSDDLFGESKIEKQLFKLKANNKLVCVCNSEFFNTKPKDLLGERWSEKNVTKNISESIVLNKCRWQTGSVLWSRDYIKFFFWNEDLKAGQEWLFHAQACTNLDDKQFCYINELLVNVRKSNCSISRKSSKIFRYKNYLKARVILLQHLYKFNNTLFNKTYIMVFNMSLKYIKYLALNNNYSGINNMVLILTKKNKLAFIYFYGALFIYKVFKKDFFLKGFKSLI